MNIERMRAVIDAIKERPTNFAMDNFYMHKGSEWENSPVKKHLFSYYSQTNPVDDYITQSYLVSGEDLFSCGTVGCIAGFAFAIMNDNKTPLELDYRLRSRYTKTHVDDKNIYELSLIPAMAAEFLGLNHSEYGNLFYGGADSVWSLIAHTDNKYGFELTESEEGYWECEQAGMNVWFEYGVDLKSISSDAAVDVLERIVSGEIILSDPKHLCYDNDDSHYHHAIYSSN